MCVLAKVPYTDKDVAMKDWPALKPNKELYPSGFLPIATIHGNRLDQTNSIVRLIARETGFYPCNDPNLALACD
jgi:hypothetical protein